MKSTCGLSLANLHIQEILKYSKARNLVPPSLLTPPALLALSIILALPSPLVHFLGFSLSFCSAGFSWSSGSTSTTTVSEPTASTMVEGLMHTAWDLSHFGSTTTHQLHCGLSCLWFYRGPSSYYLRLGLSSSWFHCKLVIPLLHPFGSAVIVIPSSSTLVLPTSGSTLDLESPGFTSAFQAGAITLALLWTL